MTILVASLCLATTTIHAKHKKKTKKHSSAPAVQVEQVPTPIVEQAPTPVVQEVPTPIVEQVPSPVVQEVPTPMIEQVPSPVVQEVPTPVVEQAPSPVVHEVPAPVVELVSSPVVHEVPAPMVEQVSSPLVQAVPTPAVEQVPSPLVQEAPTPAVEQIPSPVVQENLSPVTEQMPSLAVQEVPSERSPTCMESAEKQPVGYRYFADPGEALQIAMHYLPENPVIINTGTYEGHETCNITRIAGHEVVQVTTLDAWAKEYDIPKVKMMRWLDMQGAEFNALKAAPGLLRGVSVVLTKHESVEACEGRPLDQEISAWLKEQGFVLFGRNFKFSEEAPSPRLQDGLFVRKELVSESVTQQ